MLLLYFPLLLSFHGEQRKCTLQGGPNKHDVTQYSTELRYRRLTWQLLTIDDDGTVSAATGRTRPRSNISDLIAAAADRTSSDLNVSPVRDCTLVALPPPPSVPRVLASASRRLTEHCRCSVVSASVDSLESSTPVV